MKCYSMLNKLLLTLFITAMSQNSLAAAVDNFVIQVQTDLHVNVPITSDDSSFTIRTKPGVTYNYNVDCNNDGVFESINKTGDFTCVYQGPDEYIIRIEDNVGDGTGFPQIYYNNAGDKRKITDIIQWGTGKWVSMEGAFRGSDEMDVSAADAPDLTLVTDMRRMFSVAISANPDVSGWNTSNVIDMGFMFSSTSLANPDVSSWNTSNVISMIGMFSGAISANPDVSGWNTANVTNMSGMFVNTTLANPDVSGWNTSNVIGMDNMFHGATSANPDVSGWNTSNVTDMRYMFRGATSANPDVSGWNTLSVTNMNSMFNGAISANPDVSGWNTSNVVGMENMFHGATSANPDVSGWNTANVQRMIYMFSGAISATPDMSSWDITGITIPFSMENMLQDVTLPTALYDATLANFNTQITASGIVFDGGNSKYCNVAARDGLINNHGWVMTDGGPALNCPTAADDFVIEVDTTITGSTTNIQFEINTTGTGYNYNIDCDGVNAGTNTAIAQTGNFICNYAIPGVYTIRISDNVGDNTGFPRTYSFLHNDTKKITDLKQWGSGKWSSMNHAFFRASNMVVSATDVPNLSNVTDMSYMFNFASLANPNTTNWDVSNVSNMFSLFSDATIANPNMTNWVTSNVTDMGSLFASTDLANPDTSNWNTFQVFDMSSMFRNALSANPDTSSWQTDNVISMSSLFAGAVLANPNTTSWNTSNVTDMSAMFNGAISANPDTSGWNTASVVIMSQMFKGASSANPNTSSWDTHLVFDMYAMFQDASLANPNTSNWNTAAVNSMSSMFEGASLANPDTSGWNTINVQDMINMFSGASLANPDVSSWDITSVITMEGFINGVTLPLSDYDAMLNHFNSQAVLNNVPFSGGNSKYCNVSARNGLINNHGWTIADGGLDSNCPAATEDIFSNGFEDVIIFKAVQSQFFYDFSEVSINDMDDQPLLIAEGVDAQHKPVIQIYLRNDVGQLQIRLDKLDTQDSENVEWILGQWQSIGNTKLTSISW